ncbi:MAG: zinc-dependent peptidase [Gracilimonas sp.]|uniref:M90 family metallopeptidase n=1 Tax=Gracilimonas sp. TaxID=1974203 RepID=UPI0019C85C9B|nr:M90 family metallopeptidase [Gracilimonas sp.]MBD3617534.1 zinc-dependent peptidase [Gracilimonas sp.]
MPLFQFLRRQWVIRRPFPEEWMRVLSGRVPVYRRLPEDLQAKLKQRIAVFMDEKLFEGCGGLTLTEDMRLIIAAHACMLILEEPSDYYPSLQSVLVYPSDYMGAVYDVDSGGVVTEGFEPRSGESWHPGNIVLSWEDIQNGLRNPSDSRNLIYHEFAHQLDYRYGLSAGITPDGETELEDEWAQALAEGYRSHLRHIQRGQQTLLDPYGAENPAEFFAVLTECFLEQPVKLRREHSKLYRLLCEFFKFEPGGW